MARVKLSLELQLTTPVLDVMYSAFHECRLISKSSNGEWLWYAIQGRGVPESGDIQLHFKTERFSDVLHMYGWSWSSDAAGETKIHPIDPAFVYDPSLMREIRYY